MNRLAKIVFFSLATLLLAVPVAHAAPLLVGSGGTGWAELTANTLLLGNGTSRIATTTAGVNGKVLALVNGVPTWVATTTFSGTAPVGVAYAGGVVTVSCGTCLTGNQSITLSGAVTGTGATSIVTSFGTISQGLLGNVGAAAAVPTSLATSTLYGTGTGGQLLGWTGGKLGFVATTTMPLSGIVGGTLSNTTIANNALSLAMLPTQANGTVLANGSGATAVPSAVSTSTLYGVGVGGRVLAWNNGALQFVATSSIQNLTLTTTGTSGAATLTGTTLNVPNYATGGAGTGVAGQIPYYETNGTALVATSTIFIMPTGRIGFGTTTPYTYPGYSAQYSFFASTTPGQDNGLWVRNGNKGKAAEIGVDARSQYSRMSVIGRDEVTNAVAAYWDIGLNNGDAALSILDVIGGGRALVVENGVPDAALYMDSHGHVYSSGDTPSVGTCGTSPSVVGDDTNGVISTSGTVSACTLTFANSWYNAPNCIIEINKTTANDITAVSTSAFTMGFASSIGTAKIYYQCMGHR